MKKCLSLLLAVAAFATEFTLCSCGGGGGGANGGYSVTAEEFTSGSKSFYIDAMNLWTLHSTEKANNMILSGPDSYVGTKACWGEITTGSFDKEFAGHAVVYFHYTYFESSNKGEISWSWDAADPNNVPTAALAMITTIHTLGAAANEDEDNDEENKGTNITGTGEDLTGVGVTDDPTALAEHFKQMRIVFDFNTGTCVMYCGCGAYSQTYHFDVRRGQ